MENENPLLSMLSTELKALRDPVYCVQEIVGIDPFPKQAEMLREFYRTDKLYTHLIATCGMRSLPFYTPILIRRGGLIRRIIMEEVNTGDYIIGQDGEWHIIRDVIRYKQSRKIYQFNLKYNEIIASSGNHRHIIDGKPKYASEITVNDMFYRPKYEALHGYYTTIICDTNIHSKKKIPIEWKVDEDFAYWLGKIVADGWICASNGVFSIAFNEQETEKLAEFIDWYKIHTNDAPILLKYQRHCFEAVFACVEFKNMLKKIGLEGNFLRKRVPWTIFNANPRVIKSFLYGYFQGDGMYIPASDRDPEKWRIGTVNKELFEDIMALCWMLGWHIRRTTVKNWNGRLNYRADIFPQIEIKSQLPVQSIQVEEKEERFVDIEVEGELFCAGNGILTHNSGKSELGAMITTYEIFKLILLGNPQAYYGIAPGTPIFVLHVANSRQQAKDTIYAQTAGLLKKKDWFIKHGLQERAEEFFFPDYNIILRCDHSNSASLAGRTAKCVFMDETARFKDNSGKFSGESVYYTVSRAVKTFGNQGKVISISSPIFEGDFQMKLMRMGQDIPTFLTYHLPTWEMNPHITKANLAAEFKLNPETAWRDYGAKPPAASEAYFRDPISVRMAFKRDFFSVIIPEDPPVLKLDAMPQKGIRYFMAGDPAFKNDAFGLALVHREGNSMVADFTCRFKQTEEEPEINAEKVKQFIIQVGRRFPLHTFVVDTWHFPETVQAIEQSGIYVVQNVVKKEQYDLLKEYIYTGKIKIPEDEILKNELLQLELHLGTKVDHPKDGSKDVADALANAVWLCHQEIGTKPEVYRAPTRYYEKVDRLPYIEDIDESVFHEVPMD